MATTQQHQQQQGHHWSAPYVSPFIRAAQADAQKRSKESLHKLRAMRQQFGNDNTSTNNSPRWDQQQSSPTHTRTQPRPHSRQTYSAHTLLSAEQQESLWNNSIKRNGFFDEKLKKKEIFKLEPRIPPNNYLRKSDSSAHTHNDDEDDDDYEEDFVAENERDTRESLESVDRALAHARQQQKQQQQVRHTNVVHNSPSSRGTRGIAMTRKLDKVGSPRVCVCVCVCFCLLHF
jgi:uncharacterized protein YdaT